MLVKSIVQLTKYTSALLLAEMMLSIEYIEQERPQYFNQTRCPTPEANTGDKGPQDSRDNYSEQYILEMWFYFNT